MSVANVTERLALLLPLIDAAAPVAYSDPPNSISPGAGYTWVILPGAERPDFEWAGRFSTYSAPDKGAYVSVRNYKILFFAGALGSGGPGDLAAACKPGLDAFKPFFLARPQLSDPTTGLTRMNGILKTTPGEDTGVTGLEWAGVTYVGVSYDLEIAELVEYTLVPGE